MLYINTLHFYLTQSDVHNSHLSSLLSQQTCEVNQAGAEGQTQGHLSPGLLRLPFDTLTTTPLWHNRMKKQFSTAKILLFITFECA